MLFSSGAASLAEVSCAARHKGTESAMALLQWRVDARVSLGKQLLFLPLHMNGCPEARLTQGSSSCCTMSSRTEERAPSQLASPRGAFMDADPDGSAGPCISQRAG